ncbi:MAG: PilN domain-containing protein [Candidatus Omnitrophica bacterium]|nr:PilN domain-containing protein [Candidatus Omnitrophota bacterium]
MLSILLGHKTAKIAQFRFKGKKIALSKLCELKLDNDIFQDGQLKNVAAQIKEFLKINRIRPQKCVFSLSHHDIVSRELVLPLLPRREAEAIIVNEIEKAPRFASNPYVYTYQMHTYPFDHNTKVIYYVFQKSLLQTAEKILRLSGCQPIAFDISPLSLLNSFVGSKDEKIVVYIDDKLSHLMACRAQECRSTYLFNSGAEDLLKDLGSAGGNGFRSFSGDIKSLLKNFYENENSEQLPIVFCGEYSLNGDFFKQMTSLTGYDCSPLVFDKKSVVLFKSIDEDDVVRHYAPVVGAIFRLRGQGHYFNIFNIWDFRKTSDYLKGLWFKVIFIALACCVVGANVILPRLKEMRILEASQASSLKQLSLLRNETLDLQQKRQALEELKTALFRQTQVLNQVRAKSWRDLFSAFNDNIPDDIWLETVSYDQREKILVKGAALDLNSVAQMMQKLKADKRFSNVNLASTNERKIKEILLYQFLLEFKFSDESLTKE